MILAPDAKKWGVAVLTALLLCAAAARLVLPWRTDTLNDVPIYYGSTRAAETPAQLVSVITAPFFRAHSAQGISAAESKPVYMAALNVWCSFFRWFHAGPFTTESQRNEFFCFTLFTFGALALVLILILWRQGDFYAGILASVVVLLSTWSFVYLYYPAYTQLSLVFFLFALMRVTAGGRAALFQSGFFSALAMLANNSLIVYVLGLALLAGARALPQAKEVLRALLSFLMGIAAVFIFFELVNSTGLADVLTNSAHLDSPLRTFINYYKRSVGGNHFMVRGLAEVPKEPWMLLTMIRYQSWTMLTMFVLLPVAFGVCLLRKGWRQNFGKFELQRVAAFWLPAFTGVLLMDAVPGLVQLGRAYFVGYVLFILGGILFWKYFQRWFKPLRWAGVFLLIVYSGETASGLAAENQAFHGLIRAVKPDSGHSFVLLTEDPHYDPARHLLGEEVSSKLLTIPSLGELPALLEKKGPLQLLVGPEIETILWNGWAGNYRPVGSGILAVSQGLRVHAGNPRKIPYYGLYPPLIFEDEFDTWRFLQQKAFGADDYKKGLGVFTQWSLVLERVSDDEDVTALAESITASSVSGDFGPRLLTDEGPQDIHAWHSRLKPDYPVSLEVVFRQKVLLERVAFQAQLGSLGNLQRSPKRVKVFGGLQPKEMKELASFELDFPAAGFWCFKDMPKETEPYRFYRLVLMSNHGNPEYMSLQELKFYGQTKPLARKDKAA